MRAQKFRFPAALMALIMVMTFMVVPLHADAQRFRDVPPSKWFYGYVDNMAEKGIVKGYPGNLYKPDDKVERQHVAVMVVKAAGIPYKGKKANFSDVPASSETSSFIAAMQEKGIIKGYEDGTFRPKNEVTRAEVSVMIAKAFGIKKHGTPPVIKGVKGHWAQAQIEALASNGIVKGYSDGTFKPQNPVTRAELAKILSVSMAVSAVQKAEEKSTPDNVYKAQDLINDLPDNQDLETRNSLQDRLMRAFLPDKNDGWFKETKSHIGEGVRLTIHLTGSLTNYDNWGEEQRLLPAYVIFENIGKSDKRFYRFDLSMVDANGLATTPAYVSSYSGIGEMKLPEIPSGVDVIPGGKVQGYVFFELGEADAVSIRYKPWSETLIEFVLN